MGKIVALLLTLVMMLVLGITAFASGEGLALEEAKQAAMDFAGVKASDVSFTKACRDIDDGREVY